MRPDADVPLVELFNLAGRVAVVTGGAGPLGSVFCDVLAEQGATVVVVDKDAERCERVAETLQTDHGGGHIGCAVDLLEEDSADAVMAKVSRSFERLDILVNNAAFTGSSGVTGYAVPFPEQTIEAFEKATRLNLIAPFSLTQRALPLLARSGHASVVNISSIYGIVAPNMSLYSDTTMGNPAAYGASKGGLGQLTRYLATVLAPQVRVNAIAPGGIARAQNDAFVGRYEALTPLGRMATESDFRGALAWLASDASAYVTGQVVAVDGGWTAW